MQHRKFERQRLARGQTVFDCGGVASSFLRSGPSKPNIYDNSCLNYIMGLLRYNPLVTRICIIPKATNTGGVTSFQAKMAAGLGVRGIQTCFNLAERPYEAVLLTGGVRDLAGLWRARRNGARIVQRLDGINWLHRRLRTGARHFLRAEYGNRLLALLRSRFVSQIVYQSEFVHGWWKERFGPEQSDPSSSTMALTWQCSRQRVRTNAQPSASACYWWKAACKGATKRVWKLPLSWPKDWLETHPLELAVAGRVSEAVKTVSDKKSRVPIRWVGLVPHTQIPALDRSAHLLYSADLNAACPNSVIEALACGLPVAAFATGALPELVTGDSGQVGPVRRGSMEAGQAGYPCAGTGGGRDPPKPGAFPKGCPTKCRAGLWIGTDD